MVNNDNELHDVTFKIRYPSKLELFFENQEDVIARYLKENGYHLSIV